MKYIIVVIMILSICMGLSAERKALVVGNAAYIGAPLKNPVRDATLISAKLTALGFTVRTITDADLMQMESALNSFSADLRPEDEAVFYYSGHGANVNGENYLIPINTAITEEIELRYKAFSCNLALEKLQRSRISVMILDACRDNPYKGVRSGSKGLAMMQGKAGSQYIIYSTEQGRTAADGGGDNSPFTESFAKYMDQPLKIEDMMKAVTLEVKTKSQDRQVPWTAGNLIEDFYFAKASPVQPTSVITQPVMPHTPLEVVIDALSIAQSGAVSIAYRSSAYAELDVRLGLVLRLWLKKGGYTEISFDDYKILSKAATGANEAVIPKGDFSTYLMDQGLEAKVDATKDYKKDEVTYIFTVGIYDLSGKLLHERKFSEDLKIIEKALKDQENFKLPSIK